MQPNPLSCFFFKNCPQTNNPECKTGNTEKVYPTNITN